MAEEFKVGQRVCMIGRGIDAMAHRHGEIVRITKTLIVVKSDRRGIEHRFNRESHRSVPMSEYGGTSIYRTCQKRGSN